MKILGHKTTSQIILTPNISQLCASCEIIELSATCDRKFQNSRRRKLIRHKSHREKLPFITNVFHKYTRKLRKS